MQKEITFTMKTELKNFPVTYTDRRRQRQPSGNIPQI